MITSTGNRATTGRVMALGLLLAALMAASLLLAAAPAHAAALTVDRNDDPDPTTANACSNAEANDCSLRGAIFAANAADGPDSITVPAGTYTLTRDGAQEEAASTGDLDVTGDLTIIGAGARATSVVGGAAPYNDRIFDIQQGGTVSIIGLTITGGKAVTVGGGVRNYGDLTLDGVVVEDNTASTGGGIDSRGGDLTLDKVAVKGNTSGYSGGIYSEKGVLNITDSTVSGNSSAELIGGVSHYSGTANITNSTISGNKAAQSGGGLVAASATINVRNSTIASNQSGGLGGGILTAGADSAVVVKNTIVAGNSFVNCGDFGNLGGVIFSQGNNISSDDSCGFTKTGDKQNTNPRLGPLQDNGGPTDTHALLSGSPAIDAASNTACPTTDQRGARRPQNGDASSSAVCDIGAFERNALTPPKVTTTTPSAGKSGVKRNTNLTATFSEQMDRATLTKSTFKLFKVNKDGTTKQVTNVTVRPTTDGLKAVLNPFGTSSTVLAANTRYRAVLTTAAKDAAGNRLDQNSTATGSQPMVWTFTTGSG